VLQVLPVADALLVQDDQIEVKALGPKVLVRAKQLLEEPEIGGGRKARERDRHITGDAVLPQRGLSAAAAVDGLGGAETRIAIQHPAAQTLEPNRVVDAQPEMPHLDLTVRAGQRQRA